MRDYNGINSDAIERATRAQAVVELHWTFEEYDNARLEDLGDLMGYWSGKAEAEEFERGSGS